MLWVALHITTFEKCIKAKKNKIDFFSLEHFPKNASLTKKSHANFLMYRVTNEASKTETLIYI